MERQKKANEENCLSYKKLSLAQQNKKISQAQQKQSNRCENPQVGYQFSQHNPIQFIVKQQGNHIKLHTYRYSNIQNPKAVIILFHGLNSHVGRAAHVAYFLQKFNILCLGYDYRGFGRSQGQRAYLVSWELHIQEAKQFSLKVKKLYPQIPLFCLGESMGGLTCYHLSLNHKQIFDGVILISPAFKTHFGSFIAGISNFLSKILPLKTRLMRPISGKSTGNPQISEDFYKDPYSTVRQRSCLSTLNILVQQMQTTNNTFKQYDVPFLIVQGGLDKVVHPSGAFDLYQNSKTDSIYKKILFYEQMWHDLLHERKIFEILTDVQKWIQFIIYQISDKKKIDIKLDQNKSEIQ